MSELKKLTSQKPRDLSGPRSANRYDYQKDWAIFKLMELYDTHDNFLLVMDYYDDVVIYDSPTSPETVSFYQIKTRDSGNWTLNRILERKQGENGPLMSIIGKMYECKMSFPDHTLSLNFISNATYSIDLKDRKEKSISKTEICLSDFHQDSISQIVKQVIDEHSLLDEPDFIELTFFQVSELLINNRETYLKGKISNFLEKIEPNGKFKIGLVYDTLFGEVKVKNNYEEPIKDFDDLAKRKGISRQQFHDIIKHFTDDDKEEELWNFIFDTINRESIPFSEKLAIRRAWEEYRLDKINIANLVLKNEISKVREIVKHFKERTITNLFNDLVEPALAEYKKTTKETVYSDSYIKVIILMEFCKNE